MEKIIWTDGERNAVFQGENEEKAILHTIKLRKVKWFFCIVRRNCLLKHIIEGKVGRENEEGDVSSYWVKLRKREDNGY